MNQKAGALWDCARQVSGEGCFAWGEYWCFFNALSIVVAMGEYRVSRLAEAGAQWL